jgi:poly(A) polymerase
MGAMDPSALPPLDLPGVPPRLLELLAASAGATRIALVGGAVRDLLLHRVHHDPWRGLLDLDLVVESDGAAGAAAPALARRLAAAGELQLQAFREHGLYGTVELELVFPAGTAASARGGEPPTTYLLDVATARQEHYPVAGENPVVRFGNLDDDLARRDFSINAMALVLAARPTLLDPHGGQQDLRRCGLPAMGLGWVSSWPSRALTRCRRPWPAGRGTGGPAIRPSRRHRLWAPGCAWSSSCCSSGSSGPTRWPPSRPGVP